jgi:UDP-N-acetylmuramate--alanine ligase
LIGNGKTVTVLKREFDRSFLHLHPNIACITSMDADHLDIYGTSDVEESFVECCNKIADKSRLFITTELPLAHSSRMMMRFIKPLMLE